MKLFYRLLLVMVMLLPMQAFAQQKIVNVYAWTGEVPEFIVRQFEKETGIKVNFSTYENNEIMYTKLRATKTASYDVVMPSSYFVDRMSKQHMLETLDKSKLPNWKNLNPSFLHPAYDPSSQYSVPFIWGVTGIFVNSRYFAPNGVSKWTDLWSPQYKDTLMLLDDTREVFSMALLSLGYSANDKDPEHIKAAFLKLKELMQNVKVFSTETVVSIIIDEDATLGMAWNGDTFKAAQDNSQVKFIYPKDGFVIWVDTFAIPANARHKNEAYAFINFMLRPDIAKAIAIATSFPITNLAGQKLLPEAIRNNPTVYPPKEILQHGQFQIDVGEETLALFEQYWEELKMSG
ncbi:ABC transporter substrate-binding protein [Aquicella lusitana]|uniref:Putrescine-binding periplasmic protein n=1 Tax=Aquicella lusitana TaxID=254246 RepID=A0A370GN98_9COXI|nr:spermidine/putrescine ABC transporter substrate-binding protein [Aquicella lusitana]RDI45205.1 spermidine/putrescine transport system substrate-binding protein [Aquicella lusitana]VVC72725.1 Spermidine/putrescine-binding periplasmic protein [Aquicella lusitana]